jgi:formylglycine-generating enzyme required for sulfatase activity
VRKLLLLLPVAACAALLAGTAPAVTIDWVTVGDPGNAADTTGYGAVGYTYKISKYEVTNTQYAEFLNAVAATDTNALYNTDMGDDATVGGITQSGVSGSFTYNVKAGFEDKPVVFVSFWDALRFANWLHNGQPTGAQDNSTTEDGAYTITAQGIADNSITRNAGATIFLTSEDEWYKAAYYDAVSATYFDYPAGTDTQTACVAPASDTGNSANCNNAVGALTDVGAYTLSDSPAGTFDQGGNAYEWNETIFFYPPSLSFRGGRGGGWNNDPSELSASLFAETLPASEFQNTGFRVASLPEPSTSLLVAAGLLAVAGWRRRSG